MQRAATAAIPIDIDEIMTSARGSWYEEFRSIDHPLRTLCRRRKWQDGMNTIVVGSAFGCGSRVARGLLTMMLAIGYGLEKRRLCHY